jgi:hypothetical protein
LLQTQKGFPWDNPPIYREYILHKGYERVAGDNGDNDDEDDIKDEYEGDGSNVRGLYDERDDSNGRGLYDEGYGSNVISSED